MTDRVVIVLDLPVGTNPVVMTAWAISALRDAGLWPEDAKTHLAIKESARRILREFYLPEDRP